MEHQLHPNLAKLAVAYDDILDRYQRGQITAEDARREIMQLVARDDQGVQWSLSPDSGQWQRRTIHGQLVPDSPPTWGVETLSAHQLSNGDPFRDPRGRILHTEVDGSGDDSALPGATLRAARAMNDADSARKDQIRLAAIVCGIAVLLGLLIMLLA